jgi:hypothetical protein
MGYLSGVYVELALQRDGEGFIKSELHKARLEGAELPTNQEEADDYARWLLDCLLDKLESEN